MDTFFARPQAERRHEKYERLLEMARKVPALTAAIAHPCDPSSLAGAVDAARLGLLVPLLVGPAARIAATAKEARLDISGYEIVDAPHSHAAAGRAVQLVREGRAAALMKGSLHTDELMAAVVDRERGLRTSRRLSHCFVMDVPGREEPLIITDAAINIAPTLEEKADIVQNAIDLACALGVAEPRVAILSAMETVNPKVPSTIEAAALCKMADRRQITGGVLDGPLALDNAINAEAARIKGIASAVAGRANVLVVPDLEAGNMLAKSLSFLALADAAGIVLGARVPIMLTSRADSVMARLASCAVAVLIDHARTQGALEGHRMNTDQGVIYVVLEHFTRHLHPRALEMERELEAGGRLSDAEIEHVAEVLEELRLLQPLIDRHPEHRHLAESVIALYTGIARRAWQNESPPESGATPEEAGRAFQTPEEAS